MQLHQQRSGQMKQVKVTVDSEVASAFKEACASSNISMASMLSQFMAECANADIPKRKLSPDYSTKRRRRAAIHKVVRQLGQIRDCEEQYRDRIPENLQGATVYENAEEFVSCLDAAIDALESIDEI
jgi:hypothetical protein